ncbi:hypothetical protein [Haloferula sp.]|uniref:hypothetical protein n=1 Tax=Haloferula sp. TaxID=2497595 RepID=UPI00329D9A72
MAITLSATHATVIFDASTGNTSSITNNGTPTGVAGTPGSLTYTGATDGFNNAGFASTDNINTLIGGAGLTDADTVTITLNVSSITGGALRSQGVLFGMSGDTSTILGGANSMLIQMEGGNIGSDILIGANSFQDAGDTGLQNFNSAILNGFTATLTADKDGYEFSLTGVHTTSPHIVTGTFSGTEFVDNFGTGHFYYTAQKFNQATALTTNITEASIDVTTVPEPSGVTILGLCGVGLLLRRRNR